MENVCIAVEQLLAVGELFKQLFLGGTYQLAVLDVALGSGCRLFAGVDLPVIPFIAEITFKKKGGSNAAVKPNGRSPCKSRFDIRRKTQ